MGGIDDGLQRDEDGALGNARAEAAGEDVEGLPDVGVAVPAEHQEEVAEGGEGYGENDEGFVAAGSGSCSVSGGQEWLFEQVPFDEHARDDPSDRVPEHGGNQVRAGAGVGCS